MVGEGLVDSFWHSKRVLLTGGNGFLGSYVKERLIRRGIPEESLSSPRSSQFDLREMSDCREVASGADLIIHLAARVGGIGYNLQAPGSLFYDNAIMGIQMLEAARLENVPKVVVIGTVCSYPKFTRIPFNEEDLWNGFPEETNAPYGLAKKMLLVQSHAYRKQYGMNVIYLIPVNLYGPRDCFDRGRSHVIPALIRKMSEAKDNGDKTVSVWGSGKASREFLYADDAAEGIVLAAERYSGPEPVNLGTGTEVTIERLANMIAKATDFSGELKWEPSMPDGQPRRRLDTQRAKERFGFEAKVSLSDGIARTVGWYREAHARGELSFKSPSN